MKNQHEEQKRAQRDQPRDHWDQPGPKAESEPKPDTGPNPAQAPTAIVKMVDGFEFRMPTDDRRGAEQATISNEELAENLGYARAGTLKELADSDKDFLRKFGILRPRRIIHSGPGRPGETYDYTQSQALYLATQSGMPNGKELTVRLIKAFGALLKLYESGDSALSGEIGREFLEQAKEFREQSRELRESHALLRRLAEQRPAVEVLDRRPAHLGPGFQNPAQQEFKDPPTVPQVDSKPNVYEVWDTNTKLMKDTAERLGWKPEEFIKSVVNRWNAKHPDKPIATRNYNQEAYGHGYGEEWTAHVRAECNAALGVVPPDMAANLRERVRHKPPSRVREALLGKPGERIPMLQLAQCLDQFPEYRNLTRDRMGKVTHSHISELCFTESSHPREVVDFIVGLVERIRNKAA
jgi:hypothetical protein